MPRASQRRELFSAKPRVVHPYLWIVEPLEAEPTLVVKPMFGGRAVYLEGRIVLALMAKNEPWRGVLVATSHEHHAALQADCPALRTHPVLGKWLYLAEAEGTFERDAGWLVRRIRSRDPRIGVTPAPKLRRNPQTRQQG